MKISWRKKAILLASAVILTLGGAFTFRDVLLVQAIEHGSLLAARVLVFMGAKVDAEDGAPEKKIPLHWAIGWHQQDLSMFFLEKGASVHRKDSDGLTALARAVYEAEHNYFDKDFQLMKDLLRLGADVNARDSYGNTILMHACGRKIVEFLLRNGADPKARNYSGQSVLHSCYYTDAVSLLLEHGADATVRDSTGQTPLFEIMHEKYYGFSEQILTNVELMIKAGLDPKVRDKWGHRAIYYALEKSLDDYVAFLERHGAGEEMTSELAATLENELAGMLFRRMHALRRASGCEVTLRNGEQMVRHDQAIFGVKGETMEAWAQCPSGGVLHGVVYGNGKVFHEFLNLDAGMGGFKPLSGFQGPVAFTVTPEMNQAEVAWVVTEKPATSIRKVLEQTSSALVSKQRVMVGRRGN